MKEITINGVAYVPASALTKQFRYTTDYIGQLCRAKKVDAQLVGRSWYVNPLSLAAHKSGRYAKQEAISTAHESSKISLSRLDVELPPSKLEGKSVGYKEANFTRRVEWKPIKYEADEEALLPNVKREAVPKRIAVDLAEGVDIAIKTSTKMTELVADELPTVSLKGKVNISSLDESFDSLPDNLAEDVPVPLYQVDTSEKEIEMIHHSPLKGTFPARPSKISSDIKFHETKNDQKAEAVVIVEEEGGSSLQVIEITLVTTVGVLSVCLLLVFFAESSIEATTASFKSGMNFSTESLTALVTLFSR